MATKLITHAQAVEAYRKHGSERAAAQHLGVSKSALHYALRPRDNEPAAAREAEPRELLEAMKAKDAAKQAQANVAGLLRELEHAQEAARYLEALTRDPLPRIQRRELGSGLREATAIALLSDLHIETFVHPDSTPTGNIYTLQIAELRLARAFDGILWKIKTHRAATKIRSLVLWIGGDTITNHLHPENVETAQLGPTAAIVWVQRRLIAGIRMLLERGGRSRSDNRLTGQ